MFVEFNSVSEYCFNFVSLMTSYSLLEYSVEIGQKKSVRHTRQAAHLYVTCDRLRVYRYNVSSRSLDVQKRSSQYGN